ncbi:hypothetical protein [Azospirillum canadense]|uniref:hypothetical protein n=1 Tax=Azospirillum canadense TaxID=403962 RepID=UPI0022267B55|nr:hypothetical protein [Azospirillum canadense]MCW2242554.1 hypothetical protein [Azospirillum canadense]
MELAPSCPAPPLYATQGATPVARSTGAAAAAAVPPPPELNPYTPLGDTHDAWRQPVAAPGQVAPGVRLLRMRDNMVGVIHTRAFKQTLIRLSPCEEITLASVGESRGFTATVEAIKAGGAAQAKARGIPLNEAELSTIVAGSDTSLHIRTRSGRLYAFQVFAETLDYDKVSDLSVIVEHDAACQAEAVVTSAAAPGDFVRRIPFDAAKMRFDAYRAFGADPSVAWLAPDHLAFDGLWLFIDYGRRADQIAKPIALNVVEGVPSPAQQEWIGPDSAMLVVKSPADTVMLQSGGTWLCVRRVTPDGPPPPLSVFAIDPALGKP